jgi:hypothetical protein
MPVRIAELSSGAQAIRYTAEKAIKENKLKLGLPTKCQTNLLQDRIELQSLVPTENEVAGYADCSRELLESTRIVEILNPLVPEASKCWK